tara:strand:+ start:1044 stop:2225 length:1182 start_codon:yes stop_codon:yes gene_type:complete
MDLNVMEEEELSEIYLPSNNKFVKEFVSFPQEKQLQILKLGLSTFNYSLQKYKTVMDGEKEDIIDKLNSDHNKEIKEMREFQRELESKIQDLKKTNKNQQREFKDTLHEKIEDEKKNIKQNIERYYKEKITQLSEKVEKLEVKKEELHSMTLTQQQEYYEKLFQEKKHSSGEINRIREECNVKIEEYRKQMEQFQKINQNSTLKGQRGEDIMYNILIECFPGCQIDTHTSKEGHKGDFSIIDDTHHGMIESKNYKKNVPKNEIQKFYNDIENNNDIDFAILCSLKSGVANKPQDFTLEFIMGKPVIFLHKVKDNKKSVLLAYTICKLILKNMQCFDITKEENQIKIKQIVKTYHQNHKKIVSQVNDFSKQMNSMLDNQYNDFNIMIELINITS